MKIKSIAGFCGLFMAISTTAFQPAGHGKIYRHAGKKTYEVLDTAGFCLYYRYAPEEIVKGKELVMRGEYFFSKSPTGEIRPLTMDNLSSAFADNTSFRYALSASFRDDRELIAVDPVLHAYKIKVLYRLSLPK
jgi:hypothetical protein